MNYCEKSANLKKTLEGYGVNTDIKHSTCYLSFITYALSPLVYVATDGAWELCHAFETDSGKEYAVLTYRHTTDANAPEDHVLPLEEVHGKAELIYKVFEVMDCSVSRDAVYFNHQNHHKYAEFMEAMRKKLNRPPYSGNKGEAYREGVRAAMSKMHELYGEDAK